MHRRDKKWTTIKKSIKLSLNAVLPRKVNKKKQKWMTDQILKLMETESRLKTVIKMNIID